MKKLLWIILLLLAATQSVQSQTAGTVVNTCGVLGQNYSAGSNRPITLNTTGELCTDGGGGGGGSVTQGTIPWVVGGAVSVTQTTSPWVVGGSVTATQGTLPWIVSATVTSVTGSVTAVSSYGDAQFAQAPFTIAASGNTQIVTRAVGTIKLFGFQMACAQATTATMRNGTGSGSALSGAMPVTTWFMPINNVPWFTTTSTNSLNLGLENSGPCNGVVYYRDN